MRDLQANRRNERLELRWLDHHGGPAPVVPKTLVVLRYRCGTLSQPVETGSHRWQSWPPDMGESAFDIVAWRRAEPD